MKKFAAFVAMSASALALSTAASLADYTLHILHINDLHSRMEAINRFDSTCSAEEATEGKCFGGIARVATKINERRDALRGEDGNVIVLDAGDQFQGSLFYPAYKGADSAEFMNKIGFDAMAVGNHEFDDGPPVLSAFIDAVEFPLISGNTKVAEAETDLAGKIEEWTILEVGGERIGILSVLATDTDVTASPGPNVTFEDEIEYLKDAVTRMEGEGVNKIVLLSHVGFVKDQEIAAAVDGIDVIVGGHSHTLLSNTVEGAPAYPTNVQNPSGRDVPIVQAYAYSKYVGELAVTFDDEGNVISATGDTILLDNSVEPDPEFQERVTELAQPLEELKARPVSEATAPIDGDRASCRVRECEMGNLVSDAILDRTSGQGVSIVVQNGGGLRASIDEGEITMGDVLSVLPFQNTLATFQLSGADLRASLEAGLSGIEDVAGKFPQVAGIRYSFDKSVAPNEGRLQSVEVMEDGSWTALDDGKTYTIATNNFMRGGGDGYALFRDNAENAYDYGPSLEEVVAEYLAANRPYTPYLDGRITEVAAAEEATTPAEEAPAEATPEPAATEPEPAAETEDTATEAPAEEVAEPATEETMEPATEEAAEPTTPEPAETTAEQPAAAPAATAADAPAEPATPQTHTIARGDNYWNLAEQFYGDPMMWSKLQEANPNYRPRFLPIGGELTVPPAN